MNATMKTKGNDGNASSGSPGSQFGIAGRRGMGAIGPRGAADPYKEPMSVGFTRIAAREVVEGVRGGAMDAGTFRKTVNEIITMAAESPRFRENVIEVMIEEVRRPIARMANGSEKTREFYTIINDAICQLKGFNPDAEYTRG